MKKFTLMLLAIIGLGACRTPEARRPVNVKSGSFIDSSVARNKELVAQEEKIIQEAIKKDTTNTYLSSTSGFWYAYQVKDTVNTTVPVFGDIVIFSHTIKDLKNRTIYSKQELKTRQYAIDKEELFYGLREGLKLMKAGEKVRFLFPSYQGYGYYGDTKKIGMNLPLLVDVELHEIIKEDKLNTN